MHRTLKLGLLPLFALGACAQPQSSAQETTAPEVAVMDSEEAVFRTVHLSITGMT